MDEIMNELAFGEANAELLDNETNDVCRIDGGCCQSTDEFEMVKEGELVNVELTDSEGEMRIFEGTKFSSVEIGIEQTFCFRTTFSLIACSSNGHIPVRQR